ncbi:hypothetical protein B0I35DRAFT_71625 [Stachybotrys elegans]|uniref:Uncharacterized protein n=1 Tax=Stachybotrys elegans TaxID=80388 RepID=A0A8K0SLY1_9HYPO|nr:hypothetical protein B0I35DRAFT_71625 [Stachybotrys elegans]
MEGFPPIEDFPEHRPYALQEFDDWREENEKDLTIRDKKAHALMRLTVLAEPPASGSVDTPSEPPAAQAASIAPSVESPAPFAEMDMPPPGLPAVTEREPSSRLSDTPRPIQRAAESPVSGHGLVAELLHRDRDATMNFTMNFMQGRVRGANLPKLSKHAYAKNFHNNSSAVSLKALSAVHEEGTKKSTTFQGFLKHFAEWVDLGKTPPDPVALPLRGTTSRASLEDPEVVLGPVGTPTGKAGQQTCQRTLSQWQYSNDIPTETLEYIERSKDALKRMQDTVKLHQMDGQTELAEHVTTRAWGLWERLTTEKMPTMTPHGKLGGACSRATTPQPEPESSASAASQLTPTTRVGPDQDHDMVEDADSENNVGFPYQINR